LAKNNFLHDSTFNQNEILGIPVNSVVSENFNISTANMNEMMSPRYLDSERKLLAIQFEDDLCHIHNKDAARAAVELNVPN